MEELLGGEQGPGAFLSLVSSSLTLSRAPTLESNPVSLLGAEGDSAARPALHSVPPEKHRCGQSLAQVPYH